MSTKSVIETANATPWQKRRKMIYAVLVVSFAHLIYLSLLNPSQVTQIHTGLVSLYTMVIPSAIGAFVGGAVWDDRNHRESEMKKVEMGIKQE